MSTKIRLTRGGTKKRPYYRLVVADSRCARDGRFIEKVGSYDPMLPKGNAERVKLKTDRIEHWLGLGAIPTERVVLFLNDAKIGQNNKNVKVINAKRAKTIELKSAEIAAKKAEAEAKRKEEEAAKKAEEKAAAEEAKKAEEEAAAAAEAESVEAPSEETAEAPVEEASAEEAPAEAPTEEAKAE